MILGSIIAMFFVISVFIAAMEAWYERDWPRDTFKFMLIFGAILVFWITL